MARTTCRRDHGDIMIYSSFVLLLGCTGLYLAVLGCQGAPGGSGDPGGVGGPGGQGGQDDQLR